MSIYVNFAIRSLLKKNQCCIDNSYIIVPDYTNTDDWSLEYTFLNFSKMNVPFRNRIIISPLYNKDNQLIYLMGITYDKRDPLYCASTPILPVLRELIELKQELDPLPAAISLTTHFPPFIIKYVNPKWESLCGYKLSDVEGKTFKILQGRDKQAVQNALQIKREILDIMR